MQRSVPHAFVFITDWNESSGASSTAARAATPALFTSTSIRPSAAITDAIPFATDSSSSTSRITSESGSPCAAASNAAPDASERTVACTRQPSRARRSAVAKPIPVELPVTIAVCMCAT